MPSLVVIGAQWGDEGKGKLVDYLTSKADWVVRYQGGNNAGHTLVVNGKTTKLHLVPSGILNPQAHCAIGAGVVADVRVLMDEIHRLELQGITISPGRLMIDQQTNLILDYHAAIDKAREGALGDAKIGTTGRGIGPAYEDRANRSAVRFADLLNLQQLKPKLLTLIEQRNLFLSKVFNVNDSISFDSVWSLIEEASEKLGPFIGNVSLAIDNALKRSEKVVFEGAQGTLLDVNFGTFPFVTSSSTLAGAASTGVGIGPKRLDYVLGVAKAYSTRVGSGPFPTELKDALGDKIRERGAEYGTTTGRPRRCGWFDAFAMKAAIRLNGADSLAITKLDVLSGLDKIKICIGYYIDGQELSDLPALAANYEKIVPKYIEFNGWQEELTRVTKWHHLPANAKLYLAAISEILAVPLSIISVGPERNSTIFSSSSTFLKNFW